MLLLRPPNFTNHKTIFKSLSKYSNLYFTCNWQLQNHPIIKHETKMSQECSSHSKSCIFYINTARSHLTIVFSNFITEMAKVQNIRLFSCFLGLHSETRPFLKKNSNTGFRIPWNWSGALFLQLICFRMLVTRCLLQDWPICQETPGIQSCTILEVLYSK